MRKQIRAPAKYPGAKSYMVQHIVPLIPPHDVYVEPFCGMANVLLNKPRSPVEVINDLSHRVTRFWKVVRDHGEEFHRRLQLTPYSAVEFGSSVVLDTDDEIEAARKDYVSWRMSFGANGQSFSETIHRVRGKSNDVAKIGFADNVSGYLSAIDLELPRVLERLRGVQIICRDALEVIPKWDGRDVLFYIDCPYVHSTRSCAKLYDHEMNADQHRAMAGVLHACQGKVIVSGYPSQLYRELFADWKAIEIDMAMHAAGGEEKSRATEVLWMNY